VKEEAARREREGMWRGRKRQRREEGEERARREDTK
jgi:hypothetical protein